MYDSTRRKALRAGALCVGSALTGCSGPAHLGVTDLDGPEREDENGETHFTFERGGGRVLTLTVQFHQGYRPSVNQFPIRLSVWHREGTRLDSLQYHLYRADRSQDFSEFYLRTPSGTPFPEMVFQRDRNGQGIRIDVPDLGFQGSGTVSLDLIVEPDSPDDTPEAITLGIESEFRLAETSPLGRNFRAQVAQDVELSLG